MDKSKLQQLGKGAQVESNKMQAELASVFPESKEIKVNENQSPVFVFDAEDLMQGLDAKYPFIKMPQGTTKFFTVGDMPLPELRATILFHHRMNVYYETSFAERKADDDKIPDCASKDGVTGVSRHTGECVSCANCHLNQFENGIKQCGNKIRLYIMPEGNSLPHILDVPPTGLTNYQNYLNTFLAIRKNTFEYMTSITLKDDRSTGGIDFCKINFARAEEHPTKLKNDYYFTRENIKAAYTNAV
jgi:hypothetical protein